MNDKRIDTRLIHAGEPSPRIRGAITMPIFQSATFETVDDQEYHDIKYVRLNNTPNHDTLHAKLAAVENGEAALVTASGMSAISTAFLALLKRGDHLLIQNCVYGGTYDLLGSTLDGLGVAHDFIDSSKPDTWEAKRTGATRAIYVETIANPLMEVPALDDVVSFARKHNLISMIDNTFASPINYRPCENGFDLSLHSATKYLNGHADIAAGVVVGKATLIERIRHKLNHLGGVLDPHACYFLQRGMKTLALRMQRHNESAIAIAQFLEGHPHVRSVAYAGLESHPSHANATRYLNGCGGMLSFEIDGPMEDVDRFLARVSIPIVAPSLGGVESLITIPARTSHRGLSPEERAGAGISETLVRVSVGIESTEDLIADFEQALGQG